MRELSYFLPGCFPVIGGVEDKCRSNIELYNPARQGCSASLSAGYVTSVRFAAKPLLAPGKCVSEKTEVRKNEQKSIERP